jgi:DNA-binding MarR family transcriptional regulator
MVITAPRRESYASGPKGWAGRRTGSGRLPVLAFGARPPEAPSEQQVGRQRHGDQRRRTTVGEHRWRHLAVQRRAGERAHVVVDRGPVGDRERPALAAVDPAFDEIVALLRRFNVESDRIVDVFASQHDLHRTDMNVLVLLGAAIDDGTAMTPGQLAHELNLSSPATTAALDRLERAGHLRRRRDPTDRRRVYLELDEQADELAAEFFVPLGQAIGRVIARFDATELDVVIRFLTGIVEATAAVRRTHQNREQPRGG